MARHLPRRPRHGDPGTRRGRLAIGRRRCGGAFWWCDGAFWRCDGVLWWGGGAFWWGGGAFWWGGLGFWWVGLCGRRADDRGGWRQPAGRGERRLDRPRHAAPRRAVRRDAAPAGADPAPRP